MYTMFADEPNNARGIPMCGRPVKGRPNGWNMDNSRFSAITDSWNPTWPVQKGVQNQNYIQMKRPTMLDHDGFGQDGGDQSEEIASGILKILEHKNLSNTPVFPTSVGLESVNNAMQFMNLSSETVPKAGYVNHTGQMRGMPRTLGHHIPDTARTSFTPPGFEPLPTPIRQPRSTPRTITSPIQDLNGNGTYQHQWNSPISAGNQIDGRHHTNHNWFDPMCNSGPRFQVALKYANEQGSPSSIDRTKWYHCPLCDCKVNSEYQLGIHNEGVKHRKRMAGVKHQKNFDANRNIGRGDATTCFQRQLVAITGEQNGSFSPVNVGLPTSSLTNYEDPRNHYLSGLLSPTGQSYFTSNINFLPSTPSTINNNQSVSNVGNHVGSDGLLQRRRGYDSDSQYGSDDDSSLHSGCSGRVGFT